MPHRNPPRPRVPSGRLALCLIVPPLIVAAGFGLCVAFGFTWPNLRRAAEIIGILWAGLTVVLLFHAWGKGLMNKWLRRIGVVALLPAALLMGGAAGMLGPDAVLEQRGERVPVTVVAVEPHSRTYRKDGERREKAWVDYRFERTDGTPVDGVLTYHGDTDGYGLQPGDRTELYIDPSGELPMALVSETDHVAALMMLLISGAGWLIVWGILCIVAVATRPRRRMPPPQAPYPPHPPQPPQPPHSRPPYPFPGPPVP